MELSRRARPTKQAGVSFSTLAQKRITGCGQPGFPVQGVRIQLNHHRRGFLRWGTSVKGGLLRGSLGCLTAPGMRHILSRVARLIMWAPVNKIYYAFNFVRPSTEWQTWFANLRAWSDLGKCREGTCQRRAYWEPRSVPAAFHRIHKFSNRTSKVFLPHLQQGRNALN
jgi:hypothetical protein